MVRRLIKRSTTHTLMALAEASLIAVLVVGLVAGVAFAGKGGNGGGGGKPGGGGGGTIVMVPMDGATEARFGERVTFDVATTSTAYPYVHLRCWQGGSLVAEGRQGFFPTAIGNEWFVLGPTPAWQGGAADCTATLEKYTRKGWGVLASVSFPVYD